MRVNVALVVALMAVSAPTVAKEKAPVLTALEIQQIQSREFEADFNTVFGALITTLQDNGYTITTSDKSAGIISAAAASKSKMTYNILWGFGSKKRSQSVSAFVEPAREGWTRLRLTIVDGEVKKNLYGGSRSDNDVANLDAAVYSAVFEKIEQVVFVRKALASPPAAPATPYVTSVVAPGSPPVGVPASVPVAVQPVSAPPVTSNLAKPM
ncbi:hypothetical protein [Glacieibacterium frigidum]|uniref:DUF4136 domain-containing protein n=1 Tax=Glacieibacterium frigidum TaxID=2593303 RepID=A0A552UHA8_9SPHN|nr:hypothetical protein [Glacieibacterium frigidum]TRW17606.1 hypothetical protein FMM06_05510 [Glacieibacterium frigidum]